jgi:hypothetical protein
VENGRKKCAEEHATMGDLSTSEATEGLEEEKVFIMQTFYSHNSLKRLLYIYDINLT